MNFYVRKGEKVRDAYGNETVKDGLYHTWYCVIESEDPEYEDIYIYHNERFDRDDGWDNSFSTHVLLEPINFDDFIKVQKCVCSNANGVLYLPSRDLRPKKKPRKHIKTNDGFLNLTDSESDKVLKEIESKLYSNFERFKKTIDTGKYKLDDLLFLFYSQGHLDKTPIGYEMSQEDFEKACFLNYVEDCIQNPGSCEKMVSNDYVRVTYPCTGHDCCAFPDRCEDVGGNGETCSMLLNLSRLCGVEEVKNYVVRNDPKMLSNEEIQQLAKIIKKLN